IVVIILFSSLIKLLILYLQFIKKFNVNLDLKFDYLLVLSLIKESTPLAIASAAALLYTKIDQIMIGAMLGVYEVGVYSISNKMIMVVAIAIGPVQISIFPKMLDWYNNNKELYYTRYQFITSIITWFYIIGTICSFLVLPYLFNSIFSKDYLKSLDVFYILVLSTFFMYNATLRSSHFTITGNSKILMISQIFAVFINIILNYFMIPKFGVFGAAYATVITQFISLFLSNLFFKEGREIFWLQLKGINPMNIIKMR
ncbi:polysaccharide biosynthesis C-terminal domain-containing protein, partial [Bacillus sp. JJ1533]|uniref:oligosaccharide flippase family protein n=1 Tax=Bacillus sp. JJ1533 TaxID=3122959 RepID=UPI002FFE03BF